MSYYSQPTWHIYVGEFMNAGIYCTLLKLNQLSDHKLNVNLRGASHFDGGWGDRNLSTFNPEIH